MIKANAKVDFNRSVVLAAVKRGNKGSLSRSGAYLRKVARSSIKQRKDKDKASQPGTPPHSHNYFKNTILFGVEADKESVVVGAAYKKRGAKNVARLHEFGGLYKKVPPKRKYAVGKSGPIDQRHGKTIWIKLKTQKQVGRAKRLDVFLQAQETKTYYYPARPYMGPALQMSKHYLAKMWEESVKK